MEYNKQAFKFWAENEKVIHIIPPNSTTDFPEGWDVPEFLKNIIKDDTIVELGCGYGRLVSKFNPEQYKGFDINPSAIKRGRTIHPEHSFALYSLGTELPKSDWLLCYTVLLHVSDEDILPMLELTTANCDNIIIAEIMQSRISKPTRQGKPPVWNREQNVYVDLLKKLNFELASSTTKSWYGIEDRINILTFKRI